MGDVLGALLEAHAKYANNQPLKDLGKKMFDMYTAGGFPPDMFLDEVNKRLKLDQLAKVFIVSEYQTLFLEHRRKSGIDEKRVDAIRRRNREDIARLIDKGELGVY